MIRLVNVDTGRSQLNTYSSIALFFNILVLSYYLTMASCPTSLPPYPVLPALTTDWSCYFLEIDPLPIKSTPI
jgi:hypothetical protein